MVAKEQEFGDFKVRIRYTEANDVMKRYHIECVDMVNLIVVFSESNITGLNDDMDLNKAITFVRGYFIQRFGFDVLSFPKIGDRGKVRHFNC
jgi:hypothetical protein